MKIPEEEDENALRAAVLTSMAVKRAKKEEASEEEKVKVLASSKSKPAAATVAIATKSSAKKVTKKVSSPKKLTLSEKKRLLEKLKAEVLKKAKGNKDREKLRLEIERLLGKDKKPIKNKSKVLPLIRKHFPNMFMKRVIIPAKDLLEDSSNVVTEVGPTTSSTQFMRKLDTLMKDLRGVQAKKVAPPKPVRKFPPPKPRNPKPAELNRQLSKADKEELKNSTILHPSLFENFRLRSHGIQ